MNVIIDTCVVIDFLQKREPFANDALKIFSASASELFCGYITAKAATDIYYLMHRCFHSIEKSRHILNQILSIVVLLDTNALDVLQAIKSPISDFEDAVMVETAIRSKIDCIITRNTEDYQKSSITIYTPKEFLKLLENYE